MKGAKLLVNSQKGGLNGEGYKKTTYLKEGNEALLYEFIANKWIPYFKDHDLISNNIKLALKLNLDGAYIPSFNTSKKHLSYSFKKKFLFIGSAHNLKEIRTKETQGIDKIVISSIFDTLTSLLFQFP